MKDQLKHLNGYKLLGGRYMLSIDKNSFKRDYNNKFVQLHGKELKEGSINKNMKHQAVWLEIM